MEQALIPRSTLIEGELIGQDRLTSERQVAKRIVSAAETGSTHGGVLGVETAVIPAMAAAYAVPFVIGFVWGLALGLLSLLGAAIFGLRCLGHWLCSRK